MSIQIGLIGRVEDLIPNRIENATLTIIGDLENASLHREMESAGEVVIDGSVISYEHVEESLYHNVLYQSPREDFSSALQVIENLLQFESFREAFEHILNKSRQLGTSQSNHYYSGQSIKARRQKSEDHASTYHAQNLHSGERIEDPWDDNPDNEPLRRTHN